MRKRIFLGIPVTENLQNKIQRFFEREINEPKLRRIKVKNLHITLVPPWHVEEGRVEDVGEALNNTDIKVAPFYINFNLVSYGPDPKRPRLIWVTAEKSKQFIQLKKELTGILLESGVADFPFTERKVENRNPRQNRLDSPAHLTIARFKPKDFKHFKKKRINKEVNWKMPVENFVLYESKLHRTGAEYEMIDKYGLTFMQQL